MSHFRSKPTKSNICLLEIFWYILKVRQNRNDFFKPTFPSKNEQTNSILLLWNLFLFVFWRKLKTPKRRFEINWPLLKKYPELQLNTYEAAPNFIQLSQNLTSDCLLTSVFLPAFAWYDNKIVLFWSAEQFYEHIMQKQVKAHKSTNNPMSSFGLIE